MAEFKFDVLDENFVFWSVIGAASILILIIIRNWQKSKLFLKIFAGLWLCSAIYNWLETRDHNQKSRTIATYNDVEWLSTSIEPSEALRPDEWLFEGLLHNKSQYDLETVTIDITIDSCHNGWTN